MLAVDDSKLREIAKTGTNFFNAGEV